MADKAQKRGLGSGLGALFGDTPAGNELDGALSVRLERVEPRSNQPRKSFDDEAIDELAESIAQFGVIQPITVRRLEGGYYQIIAGERRWRAARQAGLEEVPIRVIAADDKRVMELALVENLQREDLSPIEEAKGYRALMDEYGLTQDEVSQSVGKSRPAIANALRLLGLSAYVLAMVEDGRLSAGHARALLTIKNEDAQVQTAQRVEAEDLSVRQTEKLAARVVEMLEKPEEPDKPKSREINVDYVAEAEKKLTGVLGRKVHIKDNQKKGKIELEYYGKEDREALISALLRFSEAK